MINHDDDDDEEEEEEEEEYDGEDGCYKLPIFACVATKQIRYMFEI